MKKIKYIASIICISIVGIILVRNNMSTSMEGVNRPFVGNEVIIFDETLPSADAPDDSICAEVFKEINDYREDNQIQPLTWSSDLEECAEIRATETTESFSHTRPNGSAWYTLNPSIMYGENLAFGYDTAEEVVTNWQKSPSHNENLLYPDFKYAGVARVGTYYAIEFCY